MLSQEFDKSLTWIEGQLEHVNDAVAHGDPSRLEAASSGLRQISIELAKLAQTNQAEVKSAEVIQRLDRIGGRMAAAREGLARKAAMVDRALGVLLPATRKAPTYARPIGASRYQA